MNTQTTDMLYSMRLHGMVTAFQEQLQLPSMGDLSFEDRFAMIVQKEWTHRENRRLALRLRAAKLRRQASIEDVDFRHPRGLDKSLALSLATCEWIRNRHNVIITGPTGIGKSFLAEAFAHKACREGFTAIYYRCPRLFRELAIARGDGSYLKLLARIAKVDLLVIDDWGISALNDTERRDFLEVMEDRQGLKSTLMTSQYPVQKWYELIGEPTLADAILDRIVHVAHKITLKGESLRRRQAKLTNAEQQP
jgi:DNA replication protein DnaC